jgi:outer membrane protein assembly factor BamA
LGENQYLLSQSSISLKGAKVKNKELYTLLKQKPNKKFLGIAPLYLGIYNLAKEGGKESYFKRIGEAPVILNYRLARKSASQLELHYKNNGYFDTEVIYNVSTKKHKANIDFIINSGQKYIINKVFFNPESNNEFHQQIQSLITNTPIRKGKFYNYKTLEAERVRIAESIQNLGYYKFNKEFIYFLADTNQLEKKVNLNIIVKSIERNANGTTIQEKHKKGVIGVVNVHLDTKNPKAFIDTVSIQGINFIHNGLTPPFNLNRLAEKIILRQGSTYNKNFVDNSYQALSELKNFKKISFEFTPINSDSEKDILSADIYLIPGKKIAYTIEVEATTNPKLKEGISGSASLSHYNIFKGAEHLQLTFKGSNNFNNIKENGVIMNLAIPSLISPIKLNRVLNKNSRTKTIFSTSVTEQQRPEFTRNSISASYNYQWKTKQVYQHKLSLFNLSYVNFQGDSTDLSNISEYLIAKDYSNHLIPTSSYTLSYNNQNINKLKNHSFLRIHIESSGNLLNGLAEPLNFKQLRDDDGNAILQENGSPSYTLNLWNQENIYTQYLKTSLDYRYYWEIDKKNSLAFRTMGGIIYAFGNTDQAPFHKKFVAGGANDLRGWKAFKRPAGSLAVADTLYTGGLKLTSSIEYRFNLIKKLKAAVFIDAGNIWEIAQNNHKYEAANFYWDTFIDQIAVDIGFGLRYDFQYFIFRTDLGFPVRDPSESTNWQWKKVNLKDSQLNIGLGYPF